ncbi:MAG: TIGR01777 family oxidoreductase [Planctomycetota bacterium]
MASTHSARVFRSAVELPVTPEVAFAWHLQPGALRRLVPGFERVVVEEEPALEVGARGVLRLRQGPLSLRWVARITELDRARHLFVDEQESGPFALWRHTHRLEAGDAPGTSRLVDEIEWRAPLGRLGARFAPWIVDRQLARTFAWRHRVTRHDLALHARYGLSKQRVAVTGASGFVGSRLVALLETGGHEVLRLVRRAPRDAREVRWDPRGGVGDLAPLEGLDAVIHLAGEPVAGLRWTDAKRDRIARSRVEGSRALVAALARLERPPGVFLAASAIGFYGSRGDEPLDEGAAPGTGFLASTCRAWELMTSEAQAFARVVQLRLGVVLDPAGGALRVMLPAFRMGLGGPLGDGRMWFPWVALDDVLGALVHALATPALAGPVNLVAPGELRQRDFARALGAALRRPAILPVPRFALRALLGRAQADEMLLASARVQPARLLGTGFQFAYPDLASALAHGLGVNPV